MLDRSQKRLDDDPSKLAVRSMTVEHPFGTIKSWMGGDPFQDADAEKRGDGDGRCTSLAYNMMRVMKIVGIPAMIAAMTA